MKELLALLQETGLDKYDGLWHVFENCGRTIAVFLAKKIEDACDAFGRMKANLK